MDHGKDFGALITHLSKAFNSLLHSLFTGKLKLFSFDNNSLKLVNDYLPRRSQRTKIGNECTSWTEIVWGVLQGLFFFIIDKFNIASFADDNTPYVTGDNTFSVVKLLEELAYPIFQWFKDNEMKANPDNCHVLLSASNDLTVKINDVQIKNSQSEK